jgi:hypothetical protein
MLGLGSLVACGVLGGSCAVTNRCVGVLGDGLVGLLGGSGDALLDGLGCGACGVPTAMVSEWGRLIAGCQG